MDTTQKKKKIRLTPVSILHYIRLVYRSALFLACGVIYIMCRINGEPFLLEQTGRATWIVRLIWFVFVLEMIGRFFPQRLESPGCQKVFARNYKKTGKVDIKIEDNNAVMLVAILWISANSVFGGLYIFGIFDDGIMALLCGAYSVCDLICILFFCPFQSWFLKNKCCSTCRIYNWDYAMMFTPFFFVNNLYAWSLFLMSLVLLLRWEITFYLHPERFSENTNAYIKCANCTEKLCTHKRQLHSLWKKIAEFTSKRKKFLQSE